MYFEDEDENRYLNQRFHVVRRELYTISSNLEVTPYGLRSVPTHTEDGIPIRKLYVSNLPPKTTRTELFGVFAQYGFIKSCWLRMGEKGPNKSPMPTYAFVTYSNPGDAHKALLAPYHEKMLRGRSLRISPADSWHQPAEDSDGQVKRKTRGQRSGDASPVSSSSDQQEQLINSSAVPETSSSDATSSEASNALSVPVEDDGTENEPTYNVLDILNRDCLIHIFSFVPIRDLIRSERVSKPWQNMVHDYLSTSIRIFKTSWWQHTPVTLTTAVLRRVLARVGGSLARLHIDHHWSALNDRTAHTLGKFCPHLDELKVVGMHTKNWNPLIYGCKQLKNLSFISCNKLSDTSLVQLVKNESSIESLTVANNTHVTGLFLTGSNAPRLTSLSFFNCHNLQGTVLSTAMDTLPNLTTLKLDVCPVSMWKIVPLILDKLPKLEELSLTEYMSIEVCLHPIGIEPFCEALSKLKELRILNLSRNIHITNAVMKQVAQSCPKLESLNVSGCNSRKGVLSLYPGIGDEGISIVCRSCPALRTLDVSYLRALSDGGVRGAARAGRLARLVARGNPGLGAGGLQHVLQACHQLQELDVCGCDNVSEDIIITAVRELEEHPRLLNLYIASTSAANNCLLEELPEHRLLIVDHHNDRSNSHLRPDFVDTMFDDSTEDSFEDLYDHDDFDDFLGPDDDLFLEDELEMHYDGHYAFAQDIILL